MQKCGSFPELSLSSLTRLELMLDLVVPGYQLKENILMDESG